MNDAMNLYSQWSCFHFRVSLVRSSDRKTKSNEGTNEGTNEGILTSDKRPQQGYHIIIARKSILLIAI